MFDDDHSNQIFTTKQLSMIRKNVVDDCYCNHGIIVQYRLSNSVHVHQVIMVTDANINQNMFLITVGIDIPVSLAKCQSKNNFILLIVRLILDDEVFDHEQISHIPAMEKIFYLNYHQTPPKRRGNWSIRLNVIYTVFIIEHLSYLIYIFLFFQSIDLLYI